MAGIKIAALPPGTNPIDTDAFAVVQNAEADTNKITWAQMVAVMASAIGTITIDPTGVTPNAPGGLNMPDTSALEVGQPLIVTQATEAAKYYIVTGIVPNTSITLAGPPISGNAVTLLEKPPNGATVQADLLMPGNYEFGGPATNIIVRSTRSPFFWQLPEAYLCYVQMSHDTPDTDGPNQPSMNVTHRGNKTLATDIMLPNAINTPAIVGNGVGVVGEYSIKFGELVELELTLGPGNLDAKDLTVALTYVFKP